MKVLDITHIPIHGGPDIGSAMQATAELMKKAPGFRIAYWGVQIEHDDTMDLLVEWDSVEHHHVHLGTDLEKEITAIIWPLIDTSRPLLTSHIPSDPAIQKMLFEAPIVEICTYKNVRKTPIFKERIIVFNEAAQKSKGYRSMVYGWKVEEDNGKEFAAIVGWSSVEDHINATEKSTLVEEMESVSELAGDVESHHVVLRQWTA